MKKLFPALILLTVSIISFVAGARVSAISLARREAIIVASLRTYDLKSIDRNDIKSLRSSLEAERDVNLLLYKYSENDPLLFLWPEYYFGKRRSEMDSAITNVIEYRKSNVPEYINTINKMEIDHEEKSSLLENERIIQGYIKSRE